MCLPHFDVVDSSYCKGPASLLLLPPPLLEAATLLTNDAFDTGFVFEWAASSSSTRDRAARPYDSLALLWEHGVRTVRDVMVRRDAVEKAFTVHRVTNDMMIVATLMVLLFRPLSLGCVD